jgi:tRNA threonylcarbamoyladenosine biosynthesis protein TsaB
VVTLALDTSTAAGSHALRRDGALVDARPGNASMPHATRLPGDLMALLKDHGLELTDVSLLAVGLGPGAFTGLRVGLATMQGLAFATGHPIVGVSALDAHAVMALTAASAEATTIGVWLDGARREVFAGRYRRNTAARFGVAAMDTPVAAPPGTVLESWVSDGGLPDIWIGSGVELYRPLITGVLQHEPMGVEAVLLAGVVADLAERALAAGEAGAPHALRPVYVRRPDAELARDRSRPPQVESQP